MPTTEKDRPVVTKTQQAPGPMASLFGCTSSIFSFILFLVFAPIFLVLWLLFTITGIGPLLNVFYSRRDKALLDALIKPSASPEGRDGLAAATGGGSGEAVVEKVKISGHSLAVRWSPGKDASLPPVCIPNGLGATLITIAGLHDVLEARGYPVLSYDRAGVGLSDPMPASWGDHPTSEHVVEDMRALLTQALPIGGKRQWVLVGPSMGSIVAQCYMAKYPGDVAGFLNVDGFPFPFAAKRAKFVQAAVVYRISSSIVWTGVLRFFISMAGSFIKKLESAHFKGNVIQAQMNEANFTGSLAKEMITMMDLAETAKQAWGPAFNIGGLSGADCDAFVNAEPSACGDITSEGPDFKWEDLPRSGVEAGEEWVPRATSKAVVDRLYALAADGHEKGEKLAPLPRLWPNLVVRALSARHYDFGAASKFYDDEMKRWAAAEHNLHVLLAPDGKRLVFPKRSHDQMFFGLLYMMARQVDEITMGISQKKGGSPPVLSSASVESVGSNQV